MRAKENKPPFGLCTRQPYTLASLSFHFGMKFDAEAKAGKDEIMNRKFWSLMFTGLLLAVFVPRAKADVGTREVKFSINEPVEMPGRVLNPGHYQIRLLKDGSSVAGIWNASGTRLYGFFQTDHVDRMQPANRAKVKLAEANSQSPERIASWFFPGDMQGNALLYPAPKPAVNSVCTYTPVK